MSDKKKDNENIKRLLDRRRRSLENRWKQERLKEFEKLKQEVFDSGLERLTEEERKVRREKLLKFVQKHVSVTSLKNSSINLNALSSSYVQEKQSTISFWKKFLIFRNFFNELPRFKSLLFLFCFFGFFLIEYFFHYHTSFSLTNVNITFKDVIDKIPPFC